MHCKPILKPSAGHFQYNENVSNKSYTQTIRGSSPDRSERFSLPGTDPAFHSIGIGILFRRYRGRSMTLTTHFQLVLWLWMTGAIPLLPLQAFMTWTRTASPFTYDIICQPFLLEPRVFESVRCSNWCHAATGHIRIKPIKFSVVWYRFISREPYFINITISIFTQ